MSSIPITFQPGMGQGSRLVATGGRGAARGPHAVRRVEFVATLGPAAILLCYLLVIEVSGSGQSMWEVM